MLSKEECEKALEHLIECKQRKLCDKCKFKLRCTMSNDELVINQLIEEHFDKNGNVKVLANIVIDEDKMKEIIDEEIKKLIVPEPYKFEDLKPNMWVWDNVAKECLYVVRPFVGSFTGVKYFTCLGIYKNLEEIRKLDIKFEENRFFSVLCANYLGGI